MLGLSYWFKTGYDDFWLYEKDHWSNFNLMVFCFFIIYNLILLSNSFYFWKNLSLRRYGTILKVKHFYNQVFNGLGLYKLWNCCYSIFVHVGRSDRRSCWSLLWCCHPCWYLFPYFSSCWNIQTKEFDWNCLNGKYNLIKKQTSQGGSIS